MLFALVLALLLVKREREFSIEGASSNSLKAGNIMFECKEILNKKQM